MAAANSCLILRSSAATFLLRASSLILNGRLQRNYQIQESGADIYAKPGNYLLISSILTSHQGYKKRNPFLSEKWTLPLPQLRAQWSAEQLPWWCIFQNLSKNVKIEIGVRLGLLSGGLFNHNTGAPAMPKVDLKIKAKFSKFEPLRPFFILYWYH